MMGKKLANKHSKMYTINDKEIELFTLGELSKRLDRQTQTLRKWERQGIIPQAKYRSGANRRLYSENQINAVVECVKKYDIKQGFSIPPEFIREVEEAFEIASEKDFL